MRVTSFLMSAAWLVLSTGCDRRAHEAEMIQVRDSVGVSIVQNPRGGWPEWTVDSLPSVDIGTLEGEDGQDLARPWSSTRLSGGRIAVSNALTNEFRIYDSEGNLQRSTGGTGEGPGEFGRIGMLRPGRGDTTVVDDRRLLRLSFFGSEGDFAKTITLEPIRGRPPRLQGLLGDTIGVFTVTVSGDATGSGGVTRDTVLIRLRPLGGDSEIFVGPGRFPGRERFDHIMANGGIAQFNLPFGRDSHVAVSDETVWVGVSDTYELRGYNPDGRLIRIVRLSGPLNRVEEGEKDRWFDHQTEDVNDPNLMSMYRAVREDAEPPPTLPAFSDVICDREGNIWVREYTEPWAHGSSGWRVFGPAGHAKAVVQVPEGLVIHEIGHDYLMGRWQDESGVEHIRVFPLHRSSR